MWITCGERTSTGENWSGTVSDRPYSAVDGHMPPDRSDTTVAAADVLESVLASLSARSTPRDRRVRSAIEAARDALRNGQEPARPIDATYGRDR